MNIPKSHRIFASLLMTTLAMALPLGAEEMVTISKARLLELEAKAARLEKMEKELGKSRAEKEKLTAEQNRLRAEAEQLKQARQKAETAAVAAAAKSEPVVHHDTPALSSLPPLQKGEVVDAIDVMNHYRTDAAAAKQRYEGRPIRVRGEISGFDKPILVRPYLIYLRTSDRAWKIACKFYPPDRFSAIFTVKGGDELVGSTSAGVRQTLASVEQNIVIEGRCRGLHDQIIALSECNLQATPSWLTCQPRRSTELAARPVMLHEWAGQKEPIGIAGRTTSHLRAATGVDLSPPRRCGRQPVCQ